MMNGSILRGAALLGLLCLVGCAAEEGEDPTKRSGFVDTSDPSKVPQTMTPLDAAGGPSTPDAGAPKQ
ncbi:MAG: hypothetical protein HYS13_03425 [Planctomycetia bacterium]|nr:hypothetical protein [Planctomycetia bacterium]